VTNHPPTKSWGDPGGIPVILIHGLTGRGALWSAVAERLSSAGFYVLTPDLRGHGNNHPASRSIAEMVEDIGDLLQEQPSPAAVVGHSLGAVVGWMVAVSKPHGVRCLVIEDQPPVSRPGSADGWRDWAGAWPHHFESRAEAVEFLEHAGRSKDWWEPSLDQRQDGSWGWAFDFAAMTEIAQELGTRDSWDDLKRLDVPTLIIRGADSPHLTPEVATRMSSVIPQSQLVTVPDADHWVHRDPEVYSKVLVEFLASNS